MLDLATPCEFLPNLPNTLNGYVPQTRDGVKDLAHRWAYRLAYGEIPEGAVIEHACHTNDPSCPGGRTCKHRACINPKHLVARSWTEKGRLTHERALEEGAVCPQGHPFTPDNTLLSGNTRYCRWCKMLKTQAAARKKYMVKYGLTVEDVGDTL